MADMSDLDDVHLGSSVILPVGVALLGVGVELLQGVGSEYLGQGCYSSFPLRNLLLKR